MGSISIGCRCAMVGWCDARGDHLHFRMSHAFQVQPLRNIRGSLFTLTSCEQVTRSISRKLTLSLHANRDTSLTGPRVVCDSIGLPSCGAMPA